MALTNAERQAAFKARKAETLDSLAQQNAALLAEVAELRAEVDRLKEKAHRLEVSALKAQIAGARQPKEIPAKSTGAPRAVGASAPAKRPGKR
jgi:cell division protein FtsB